MSGTTGDATKSFDELLHPFDREEFFAEHWRKKPLHVVGAADKFARLPGLDAVPGMLFGKLTPEGWTTGHAGSSALAHLTDASGQQHAFPADSSMWSRLYNLGTTFCFPPMDGFSEALKQLVAGFKKSTPFVGDIFTNCYVTPPHAGSKLHFDSQDVFFLQISGEKHWKIGNRSAWDGAPTNLPAKMLENPAVAGFLRSAGVNLTTPEETGTTDLVLRPGDVLYLPPGVWHHGHTESQHSFHYTLTFAPIDAWNFVFAFLRAQLLRHPSWRQDLRYPAADGPSATESIGAALQEVRDVLARATPEDLLQIFSAVDSSPSTEVRDFFSRNPSR